MPEHEKLRENLIRRTVRRLDRGYHRVHVDLSTSRHQRPTLIRLENEAFRPDITVYSGSTLHIYAVETEESVADPLTHRRWETFAEYAGSEPERIFHIVVPAGAKDHVRLWLTQLSISAEVETIALR